MLDLCNELMSFVPVCGPLWDAVKASQRRDTVGYVLNFCLAVLDVVSLGISVEVKAPVFDSAGFYGKPPFGGTGYFVGIPNIIIRPKVAQIMFYWIDRRFWDHKL